MDAIVLVGGQGTRLLPLTARRHKSLVPVCNQPAISYLFAWLTRSGMQRIVLAIGQNNEDLADAYPTGKLEGIDLVQVTERSRLESGGAIRNAVAEAGIEGRFVVVNGDLYVDFNLQEALDAHAARGADLTLTLCEVPDPTQFGVAVVDDSGQVTGFVEKPPLGSAPSNLINAGVWIFEPGLVAEIPPGAVRVEETLFPSLVARRRTILGYPLPGIWADIGTPARYLDINLRLLAAGFANHDRSEVASSNLAGDVAIEEDARINSSVLGPGCHVAARAQLDRSVLWESVSVGAGATVRDSIVADGVTIGDDAAVDGAVIGSGATVPAGATLPPGTVLEPDQSYHGVQ